MMLKLSIKWWAYLHMKNIEASPFVVLQSEVLAAVACLNSVQVYLKRQIDSDFVW